MNRRTWLLVGALVPAGCAGATTTPATQSVVGASATLASVATAANTTAATLVSKGQLFCSGANGIIAVVRDLSTPSSIIGEAASVATTACQIADATSVPVPAPANPAAVPVAVVATAPA
jgi:hypothetical protein